MRHFHTVEIGQRLRVISVEPVHRMRGDRQTALRVHIGDRATCRLIPIDGPLEADTNHMVVASGDLLADEDDRPDRSLRSRSTKTTGERLVVIGDGDHVEPEVRCVILQHPRCDTAVANERVNVEVARQHLIALDGDWLAHGLRVSERAQRDASDEATHRKDSRAAHAPTNARILCQNPETRKT